MLAKSSHAAAGGHGKGVEVGCICCLKAFVLSQDGAGALGEVEPGGGAAAASHAAHVGPLDFSCGHGRLALHWCALAFWK